MKFIINLFFALLCLGVSAGANPPVEEGKSIFISRCAACHNVNKTLTGPALAGVEQRRSIEWIINFVHSSQTMVKDGDKDAVALYTSFNNIPMPDHSDLTDAQIKDIVAYIITEAKPIEEVTAPFSTPSKLRPAYQPLGVHDYGFFIAFLSIVALLVGVLLFAVRVKEYERTFPGRS